MVDELKTLKDINSANSFDRNKFSVRQNITKLYSEKELRQEAIKDIKELKKIDCKERHPIVGNTAWSYSEEAKNAIINYISWKFNILEEDYKMGEQFKNKTKMKPFIFYVARIFGKRIEGLDCSVCKATKCTSYKLFGTTYAWNLEKIDNINTEEDLQDEN